MDGVRPAVDASAMRERRIVGGIVAEHLNVERGPCLKEGTAGEHLDLHGNDFVGLDRLALPMRVKDAAWPTSHGIELAMGHTQPPFSDAIVGEAVISVEEKLLARGIELAKQDEEIHVVAFGGGDPQRERH